MRKLVSAVVVVAAAVATFTPVFRTLSAHASTNTTVVLTFDDDRSDQMTANSLMDARGMVGTFYVNSNTVGDSGHMSWAQLQALQASGDEIGGHTLDFPHVDLTTGLVRGGEDPGVRRPRRDPESRARGDATSRTPSARAGTSPRCGTS